MWERRGEDDVVESCIKKRRRMALGSRRLRFYEDVGEGARESGRWLAVFWRQYNLDGERTHLGPLILSSSCYAHSTWFDDSRLHLCSSPQTSFSPRSSIFHPGAERHGIIFSLFFYSPTKGMAVDDENVDSSPLSSTSCSLAFAPNFHESLTRPARTSERTNRWKLFSSSLSKRERSQSSYRPLKVSSFDWLADFKTKGEKSSHSISKWIPLVLLLLLLLLLPNQKKDTCPSKIPSPYSLGLLMIG